MALSRVFVGLSLLTHSGALSLQGRTTLGEFVEEFAGEPQEHTSRGLDLLLQMEESNRVRQHRRQQRQPKLQDRLVEKNKKFEPLDSSAEQQNTAEDAVSLLANALSGNHQKDAAAGMDNHAQQIDKDTERGAQTTNNEKSGANTKGNKNDGNGHDSDSSQKVKNVSSGGVDKNKNETRDLVSAFLQQMQQIKSANSDDEEKRAKQQVEQLADILAPALTTLPSAQPPPQAMKLNLADVPRLQQSLQNTSLLKILQTGLETLAQQNPSQNQQQQLLTFQPTTGSTTLSATRYTGAVKDGQFSPSQVSMLQNGVQTQSQAQTQEAGFSHFPVEMVAPPMRYMPPPPPAAFSGGPGAPEFSYPVTNACVGPCPGETVLGVPNDVDSILAQSQLSQSLGNIAGQGSMSFEELDEQAISRLLGSAKDSLRRVDLQTSRLQSRLNALLSARALMKTSVANLRAGVIAAPIPMDDDDDDSDAVDSLFSSAVSTSSHKHGRLSSLLASLKGYLADPSSLTDAQLTDLLTSASEALSSPSASMSQLQELSNTISEVQHSASFLELH